MKTEPFEIWIDVESDDWTDEEPDLAGFTRYVRADEYEVLKVELEVARAHCNRLARPLKELTDEG